MKQLQTIKRAYPYAVTYDRWFRDRDDNQDYEQEIEYFRTKDAAESFAARIQARSIIRMSNVQVVTLKTPKLIDDEEDY